MDIKRILHLPVLCAAALERQPGQVRRRPGARRCAYCFGPWPLLLLFGAMLRQGGANRASARVTSG